MGIVNFVFRRGAIYTWRRRVPARVQCEAIHLQVSLGTACPWTARRLAGIVTQQSEKVFEAMALASLSRDAAKKWLVRVIREELQRIERRNRAQSDSHEPGYARANAGEDRAMAHALRLLARDGIGADLGEAECAELASEGVPDRDLLKVETYMQQAAGEVLSEAVERKIREGVLETANLPDLDAHQFLDSRRIYLQGRAAAYLSASRRKDVDFAEALVLAERLSIKDDYPVEQLTSAVPASKPEPKPAYDPAITAVADRLASKKAQRDRATDKTAYQIRNTAALLVEATGVTI